jgi:hypothetical protein
MHATRWNIGAAAAAAALAAAIATAAGTGQIHFGNAADSKPAATTTQTTAPSPSPRAKAHHQHKAGRGDGTKITINNNTAPTNPAPSNPAPAAPAGNPQLTSPVAVVQQYYQDLNDQNYQAAWQLGGDNIGGADYNGWAAGYSTTASISVTDYGTYSDGTVWADISAVQTDGTVKTYDGTYTVANGVIVSANMTQTS